MPFARSLRDSARYAPIAIIGGAAVGFLLGGFRLRWPILVHGAFIGFMCFAFAVISEALFHNWLDRGGWWRRALVYFIASQIGWPLALFLGMPLLWGQPMGSIHISRAAWAAVIFCGGAGTAIGVSIYGYEALKERLQRSIEQLKDKEIAEKELELAREFQARLLPAAEIEADGYRISSRNLPARYVAGDFCDVFQYADGAVGIAIADVAGKGVAASLIMASVKAVLPLLAATRTVSEAMGALNEKLIGDLAKREFVALALARFEPGSGAVSVSNAGLPDPYIVRRDGSVEAIEVAGPRLPLGLKRSIAYERRSVSLDRGDAMILLSDGLPEATANDGEQLGYDRLAAIIAESRGVDEILRRIESMTVATREDDQTIVMLERKP